MLIVLKMISVPQFEQKRCHLNGWGCGGLWWVGGVGSFWGQRRCDRHPAATSEHSRPPSSCASTPPLADPRGSTCPWVRPAHPSARRDCSARADRTPKSARLHLWPCFWSRTRTTWVANAPAATLRLVFSILLETATSARRAGPGCGPQTSVRSSE